MAGLDPTDPDPHRDQAAPGLARAGAVLRRRQRISACRTNSCASTRRRPRCAATGPGRKRCRSASATSTIAEVEAVGHYAIRPKFSDGHDTGIYSWDYLYDLGRPARRDVAEATSSGSRRPGRAATRKPNAAPVGGARLRPPSIDTRLAHDEKTHFGFEEVSPGEKTRRVRGVFDSVAGKYDLMNDLMSAGLHRAWKRFTVQMSGVRAGQRVLDVAGGTADLARLFAERVGPDGTVVLTDINGAMLAVGRDRMLERRAPASRGAVQRRGAAFPAAQLRLRVHRLRPAQRHAQGAALAEMRRVLRPGGVALVLEFSRAWEPLRPAYDWYSFNVLPRLGKLVAGDEASYRYLAESIRMHPDQPALKAMMEQAGLERVEWFNLTGGVVALHRGYVF